MESLFLIRTLRDVPTLLADESTECQEVKGLLERRGIQARVTLGTLRPNQRRPLLLHNGGTHQGIEQIRNYLKYLEFENKRPDSHLFE